MVDAGTEVVVLRAEAASVGVDASQGVLHQDGGGVGVALSGATTERFPSASRLPGQTPAQAARWGGVINTSRGTGN